MKIIKFDLLPSTNEYLKSLIETSFLEDFSVVITSQQTSGKGQRGVKWKSEPHKNLTFSIYKIHHQLSVRSQFTLNMIVSLAVYKAISDLKIPDIKIKWPNDIMSANKKLGGILIENSIKSNQIKHSIIGIGLNINQTDFENLPQASSLKNITGMNYDLDILLTSILNEIKSCFQFFESQKYDELKQKYLKHLYRINKVSTFQSKEGIYFSGIIKSVNDYGLLIVKLENGKEKIFDIKEIKLMN